MRLRFIAVGRLKAGPERDLIARYQARAEALGRALRLSAVECVEVAESRARREADRRAEEAGTILDKVGASALVSFDEGGGPPPRERLPPPGAGGGGGAPPPGRLRGRGPDGPRAHG